MHVLLQKLQRAVVHVECVHIRELCSVRPLEYSELAVVTLPAWLHSQFRVVPEVAHHTASAQPDGRQRGRKKKQPTEEAFFGKEWFQARYSLYMLFSSACMPSALMLPGFCHM